MISLPAIPDIGQQHNLNMIKVFVSISPLVKCVATIPLTPLVGSAVSGIFSGLLTVEAIGSRPATAQSGG